MFFGAQRCSPQSCEPRHILAIALYPCRYRGIEVTADVIDGPQSVIYDQAENRQHAQKAVVLYLLGVSV